MHRDLLHRVGIRPIAKRASGVQQRREKMAGEERVDRADGVGAEPTPNGSKGALWVYLPPSGAAHLHRSRGGQNAEPEDRRRHVIALPQLGHDAGDVSPRRGGVMLDLASHLPGSRAYLVQLAPYDFCGFSLFSAGLRRVSGGEGVRRTFKTKWL